MATTCASHIYQIVFTVNYNPYPAISFVLKLWSAFYFCCICSNALQNTFTMEATNMYPDKTVPKSS